MALSKTNAYKYEISETGAISVRRADIISEDGVEIARNYHRHLLQPGADLSNEIAEVQAIAAIVHTTERISAYQATLASLGD